MSRNGASLTAEDWVKAALDALHAEGQNGVKIEPLARRLGVTKGSFYWHFKDLRALKTAVLAGWETTQLAIVEGLERADHPAAEDRIRALIDFTVAKDTRHDVAMRAWALVNPAVHRTVARVDRVRLDYAHACFAALGLPAAACAFRARLLYFYQIGDSSIAERDPDDLRRTHALMRIDILTLR